MEKLSIKKDKIFNGAKRIKILSQDLYEFDQRHKIYITKNEISMDEIDKHILSMIETSEGSIDTIDWNDYDMIILPLFICEKMFLNNEKKECIDKLYYPGDKVYYKNEKKNCVDNIGHTFIRSFKTNIPYYI